MDPRSRVAGAVVRDRPLLPNCVRTPPASPSPPRWCSNAVIAVPPCGAPANSAYGKGSGDCGGVTRHVDSRSGGGAGLIVLRAGVVPSVEKEWVVTRHRVCKGVMGRHQAVAVVGGGGQQSWSGGGGGERPCCVALRGRARAEKEAGGASNEKYTQGRRSGRA